MAPKPPRPTSFWLKALERRRARMLEAAPYGQVPLAFASEEERRAAIRFFNAALRAEESGVQKAHELAARLRRSEPELSAVLQLYGDEEGWHHQLLHDFLPLLGGAVTPMGRVTRTFYGLYGRAKNIDTILLTNLMFETIGATTYKLALRTVREPQARAMLRTLAHDEAFHVPLNIHFLRESLGSQATSLSRAAFEERSQGLVSGRLRPSLRLRLLFQLLFVSLGLLPWASRPKARDFDRLGTFELSRAYLEALTRVFDNEPDLGLAAPRWPLRVLDLLSPGTPKPKLFERLTSPELSPERKSSC